MCTPEGCVSLLSLIPHLIKQLLHGCVVVVGVAGWNTYRPGSDVPAASVVGGLAHCWVLRRHPFWVLVSTIFGLDCLTWPCVVVVVVVSGSGCGCVLSVA